MNKDKLLSLLRAAMPFLVCFALCVVMAQAQDSITNISHNTRSSVQTIAVRVGQIILCVGLIVAIVRRSVRTGIASLVVGCVLIVAGDLYNALTGSL